MRDELADKLYTNYPEIFTNRENFWGFECGDGWYDLIDSLCSQITHHLKHNAADGTEPFVVEQVKEKFGGLRFYGTGGDDRVRHFIWFAEGFSQRVCETCGAPGKTRGNSWIYTSCDQHAKEGDE
jgi:hypothetical protein